MSADAMSFCASCGVKESDDVKLKNCAACHLVKYCGVNCQKEHRPKHKRACKQRAAELHDEILFKQPESSHLGDCPICFLPLPLDPKKCTVMTCCSKIVCDGCKYTNQNREIKEKQHPKCPFCRRPVPKSPAEADKWLHDRAAMNDPVAMFELGTERYTDDRDYLGAFQYFSKAVQLGHVAAHCQLASMHYHGHGVEKDEKTALYHWEQAAIGGDPEARFNLGGAEWINGKFERAIKHFIIGANLGHDKSLRILKMDYKKGLVSKDDLAAALRGHQAAVDATKSPSRTEAAKVKAEAAQQNEH